MCVCVCACVCVCVCVLWCGETLFNVVVCLVWCLCGGCMAVNFLGDILITLVEVVQFGMLVGGFVKF